MALVAAHVFFDIGGTLGEPQLSPEPDLALERLDLFPGVAATLDALCRAGASLGIISNIGEVTPQRVAAVHRALTTAGIGDAFTPDLILFGSKDSPDIFRRAAAAAGVPPARCVFVGEDAAERRVAVAAGLRAAPHPSLALDVASGEPLRFVRIERPAPIADATWRRPLLQAGIAPVHVTGPDGSVVYAIASRSAVTRTINMRFIVQMLGEEDLPAATDLYLLRDDLAASSGFLDAGGQATAILGRDDTARWLIASSMEGLLVAVPGDRTVDDLHLPIGRHGHNLKLSTDPTLLLPFGEGQNARTAAFLGAAPAERALAPAELSCLAAITPEVIGEYVDRLTGAAPLNGVSGRTVTTRHSMSDEENRAVVKALRTELDRVGSGAFEVRLHAFTMSGKTLHNVEAEWRGTEPGIVIVSAHLDSTAASSHAPGTYQPAIHAAPGADDDASGVAGVLAIARALRGMPVTRPKLTVRFVLFNGEEQGLVGSGAYARAQAGIEAPIVGVYQLDMIGRNNVPPALFEVHAGYSPAPDVETRSRTLAARLHRLTPIVSSGLTAPELMFTRGPGVADRDPAEGRSDHGPFNARGYAGCCISEDFFANAPGMPVAEGNADYHKATDTGINRQFTADIARVVAAAVWITAHS
jgi:bacterial leucyl aminopeptidase